MDRLFSLMIIINRYLINGLIFPPFFPNPLPITAYGNKPRGFGMAKKHTHFYFPNWDVSSSKRSHSSYFRHWEATPESTLVGFSPQNDRKGLESVYQDHIRKKWSAKQCFDIRIQFEAGLSSCIWFRCQPNCTECLSVTTEEPQPAPSQLGLGNERIRSKETSYMQAGAQGSLV